MGGEGEVVLFRHFLLTGPFALIGPIVRLCGARVQTV